MLLIKQWNGQHEVKWELNNKTHPTGGFNISSVSEIEADGKELEFILQYFENIHKIDKVKSIIWYDFEAKFIVGNIFNLCKNVL